MGPIDDPGTVRALQIEFSQADYDEFARISGDANPIHVDAAFAARTRFGTTVAHGMLLFGRLWNATRGIVGDETLVEERLMFPAPTPPGIPLLVRLESLPGPPGRRRVAQEITTADGTVTAIGEARYGTHAPPSDPADATLTAAEMHGLHLGDRTAGSGRFSARDVAAWWRLLGGSAPTGSTEEVPPPLISGLVSRILGTDLPGEGTNWLKAHYRFLGPVAAGSDLTAVVEVVRLRPDKGLVDLSVRIEVPGSTVVDGRALVLYRGRSG